MPRNRRNIYCRLAPTRQTTKCVTTVALHQSHEVLEYPKLAAALFARELGRKSVKELREICKSKGIDTSACIDKRDLVDMIVRKPIVSLQMTLRWSHLGS